MGSLFFASVDEELWGDVAIAMLTLFRVATFEDWTDVMFPGPQPIIGKRFLLA
jgi:voltage-gated sodium channel